MSFDVDILDFAYLTGLDEMSFTMEENLESGWVSVRPKVFDEKERHKFVFIVAWNDVEGKFAITCHNRTVQRRSAFLLEPVLDGNSAADKCAKGPAAQRHDEPLKAAKVRAHSAPKGRTATKASKQVGNSPTSECFSHAFGSWDIVTPKVLDMELVEPVDIALSPEDVEPEDGDSSGGSSHEDFSWAGLFSFQDLKAAHHQLCAVNSDLGPCLPVFPEELSAGVWTVLFGSGGMSQRETDTLCYQLQVYLGHALDTCGWKILSQVLFAEGDDDTDEYYESLSELRQKGYEDALERAKRSMQEVSPHFFLIPPAPRFLVAVLCLSKPSSHIFIFIFFQEGTRTNRRLSRAPKSVLVFWDCNLYSPPLPLTPPPSPPSHCCELPSVVAHSQACNMIWSGQTPHCSWLSSLKGVTWKQNNHKWSKKKKERCVSAEVQIVQVGRVLTQKVQYLVT